MDDTTLSHWLALRERADAAARSEVLTQMIAARLPADRVIRIVDLATGAGSNLRYLVERLPARQHWRLVDRSHLLLADLEERTRAWAAQRGYRVSALDAQQDAGFSAFAIAGAELQCHVERRAQNLGAMNDPAVFEGRDLVTASALLDLVSESWLRALAAHCCRAGAAALLTISYDGRFSCDPMEAGDELARRGMNLHQRRDKGLGGPAQGPDAAACAERCFAQQGYRVTTAASDWMLGPEDAAMQRILIDGWSQAASEAIPEDAEAIAAWRLLRLAHVDAGRSRLVVGHRDLAAWPE